MQRQKDEHNLVCVLSEATLLLLRCFVHVIKNLLINRVGCMVYVDQRVCEAEFRQLRSDSPSVLWSDRLSDFKWFSRHSPCCISLSHIVKREDQRNRNMSQQQECSRP